jgi:hypothetical protein
VYAPSGDDDDRKIVVSLQGLRDRAQNVVISVFRAADDDDHRAFGQLVSRFNQSTSRA